MATAQEIAANYAAQLAPHKSKWEQARNSFDYETQNLARQRDDAQRSEYISMMNAQKQLPQILRASGAHGGMVGSQGRRVANAYADARQGHDSNYSQGYADADFRLANARTEYDTINAALKSAQAAQMAAAMGGTGGGYSTNESSEDSSGGYDGSNVYREKIPAGRGVDAETGAAPKSSGGGSTLDEIIKRIIEAAKQRT